MAENIKDIKIKELKSLLETGTPIEEALSKIGEERTQYIIKEIGIIKVRANTVGGCPIGAQYCGCERWV